MMTLYMGACVTHMVNDPMDFQNLSKKESKHLIKQFSNLVVQFILSLSM